MSNYIKLFKNKNKFKILEFINNHDYFLFDCDGVIWNNGIPIPGAVDTINYLKDEMNKKCLFLTNNATKSRSEFLKKFSDIGINIKKEEFFSSTYLASVYLNKVLKLRGEEKVFVIGMSGLKDELKENGVNYYSLEYDHPVDDEALNKLGPDPNTSAVLIGLDHYINYAKYSHAFQLLTQSQKQVTFLATSDVSTYSQKGLIFPATGAITAPIIHSTNRKPVIVGKPDPSALECIKELFPLDPNRTCMIGDRLDTDIKFGINGGLTTLLALSGITKEEDLNNQSDIIPDYVVDSLAELYANN